MRAEIEPYMDRIVDAIVESGVSPTATEAAAPLVDAFVDKFYAHDSALKVHAVECGFHIWVDSNTLVIGVQDLLAEDVNGFVAGEWKTAKEPKVNKDGTDSEWWNESVWYRELTEGPQLAIYALAQKRGIYFSKDVDGPFRAPLKQGQNPRILVRAAVKASKPKFWPSIPNLAIREFKPNALASVERALLAKAETIRALRNQPHIPWQLTGKQCKEFNRQCQFWDACTTHQHPELALAGRNIFFNPHDPAYGLALPFVEKAALQNDRLVILSASSYTLASSCLEKFRIISGASGDKDHSVALDTGTAFHAGVAEYFRILKETQR